MAVQRRGHAYDPDIVDAYLNLEDRGEQPGGRGSVWEQLAAARPRIPVRWRRQMSMRC